MAGLIKNIPVLNFGLQGNRGLGFPILGHLTEGFQSGPGCELEHEETNTIITTEDNSSILLVCSDVVNEVMQPTIGCVLATQEDREVEIFQQEGYPFVVNCE